MVNTICMQLTYKNQFLCVSGNIIIAH